MFSGLRTASRCAFVLTSTRRSQYNLRVQRHCCRPSVRVMASDEASAAKKAAESGAEGKADQGQPTIFDKIISKDIPAKVLFEDDQALAFEDINPQAPVHFLVIPKHRDGLTGLSKADDRHAAVLGHLLVVANKVAQQKGCKDGYRVTINDGVNGCQSVFHLHLHIMGGRQLVDHLLQQHDKQPITSLFTGLAAGVMESVAQLNTD